MTITPNALSERAMLVSLSVSIWSARKHDVRISDKVAAEHGADRSMGRYAKHLIPRDLLAAVNAANAALREHHNLNTLAWGDDGTRILPAANYLGYQAQQQTLEDASSCQACSSSMKLMPLRSASSSMSRASCRLPSNYVGDSPASPTTPRRGSWL
jgi:hypothetical protein